MGKHKLDDLKVLQSKIKPGMTEADVVALAGKPDDSEAQGRSKVLAYNASMTEMLIVALKDGIVKKVHLMTPPSP